MVLEHGKKRYATLENDKLVVKDIKQYRWWSNDKRVSSRIGLHRWKRR